MKNIFLLLLTFHLLTLYSHDSYRRQYNTDAKTGCRILNWDGVPDDSMSWSGGCKNKLAEGSGTLTWYQGGKKISNYTGMMKNGQPNGQGNFNYSNGHIAEGNFVDGELNGYAKLLMGPGRQLQGNFVNGKFLNLDSSYRVRLQRQTLPIPDSTNLYIGDGSSRELFYYALVPASPAKGVLVLLPGTWESPEYVLSSNKKLVQMAYEENLAVIVPSLNQRLAMNDHVLNLLNTAFNDAINKYKLPKGKFIIGGFSMGGLMSLRYTEMALQDSTKTTVVPKAVYSVDGPADLEGLYRNFRIKAEGSSPHSEARYGLKEFDQSMGGPPDTFHSQYVYYSTYSRSEKDGGNAKYLANIPVRIYTDVDPNWWMTNRYLDMYDMNGLDQSAMILHLTKMGNKRAEFINAFGMGYRIEGNRHPHSWSIVNPAECLKWILACLG
jgi:hypothetical protein